MDASAGVGGPALPLYAVNAAGRGGGPGRRVPERGARRPLLLLGLAGGLGTPGKGLWDLRH
ncbi:hypothetical protein [Kitasatospora indigofera]|uniref:hypothetical protein n=1 Tax=Kitasatospora indigofera TaxID=67307 RepID=UPI0033BCFFF6